MWNWLASSLAFGSTLILYEGSPFYPDNSSLLEKMDSIDVTIFGTSAKYISFIKGNYFTLCQSLSSERIANHKEAKKKVIRTDQLFPTNRYIKIEGRINTETKYRNLIE